MSGACFSIDLFLRLGPFPPPSPPPLLTALFEGFSSTMDPSELLACSPTASPSRLPVAARDRSCDCEPDEGPPGSDAFPSCVMWPQTPAGRQVLA